MSDPAVEAAQRAWASWDWSDDQPVAVLVEAAAREMAYPVREWFRWWNSRGGELPQQAWGELARLIYTAEELEEQ